MKHNCALFLAATKEYAFAIANVIIGAAKHSPNLFDAIIIYHDGFCSADLSALRKLGNVFFITYSRNDFFRKADLEDNLSTIPAHMQRWTHMSYARFEMFKYLNDFNHVIYLDFDMLIQGDISELLNYDLGMVKGGVTINYGLGQELEDIDGNVTNFGSCTITASDKIPYNYICKLCYQYAKKFYYTSRLSDQPILNYVFAKLNIKVSDIGNTFNGNTTHISTYNAKILHSYGNARRFWNNQRLIISYPEWHENNQKWIDAGGTPYSGKIHLISDAPRDKGYLVQYLERIQFAYELSNNLSKFTSLPLYLNTNFMQPYIIFNCHGLSKTDFILKIVLNSITKFDVIIEARGDLSIFNSEQKKSASEKIELKATINRNNYLSELAKFFDLSFEK